MNMPDFSSIISKSIEVTKKQKWIWLYAVALSLFSGGMGSGMRGFTNAGDLIPSGEKLKSLPQEPEKVMGAMTSALTDWITSIPAEKWILLGLAIFLLVIFSIIISYVGRAWAKSGLIYSLDMALKEELVTLANTSPQVFGYIKNMIVFGIIQALVGVGIMLGVVIVWGILYGIINSIEPLRSFLQPIIVVIGAVGAFYLVILLSLVGVFGDRKIILENTKPLDTWKQSFHIARKNMRSGILMGIVSSLVAWLFSVLVHVVALIILGLPIFVLLFPSISRGGFPPVINIVLTGINVVVFFVLSRLVTAVTLVFKYANWNQYYQTVMGKKEN